MTFFELWIVELNPWIRCAFGNVWNIELSLKNIVSTHHVCMAGTQGNVGARPMGSGIQMARRGALMRVKANTKYTEHNIHMSWCKVKINKHTLLNTSKQRLRQNCHHHPH